MRTFLLHAVFIFNFNCVGQNWLWDTVLPPASENHLRKDPFQNIYSWQKNGNTIQKLNQWGQPLWQYILPQGLSLSNLATGSDSSVFMTGLIAGTAVIGTASYSCNDGQGIFIAKLSGNGNFLWLKTINGEYEWPGDLCCVNNTVFVIGSCTDSCQIENNTYSLSTQVEYFIAKYNAINGQFITVKFASQFTGWYPSPRKGVEIENDNNNDLIFISQFPGPSNCYLVKIDTSLNRIWSDTIQGFTSEFNSLRINASNDPVYIQNIYGVHAYGPLSEIFKYSGGGSGLMANYVNNTSAEKINEIDIDSCNNVYFTGYDYSGNYDSTGFTIKKHHIVNCQLSPQLSTDWFKKDTAIFSNGTGIVAIAPHRCFVAGNFSNKLFLKDSMYAFPNLDTGFYAVIQATFGLPSNVTPTNNQLICANKSTSLICQTAGSITWHSSPTSTVVLHNGSMFPTNTLTAGTYTWYTEAHTCTNTTGRIPITVTVQNLPNIMVNSGTICSSASFTMLPTGGNNFFYNPSGPVVNPSTSSVYTVTGASTNGCTNIAVAQVLVLAGPQLSVITSTANLCRGQTATLTLNGAQSYSFNLQTSSGSHVVTPSVTSSYLIVGSSGVGCTSSILYTQNVIDCLGTDLDEKFLKKNFKIYPNPNSGAFFIDVIEPCRVIISDAQGRIILDKLIKENEQITLANNLQGFYFLKIIYSAKEEIKKILVQ